MTQNAGKPSDAESQAVGVDGSTGSEVALRWALSHADMLGRVRPIIVSRGRSVDAERLLNDVLAEAEPDVALEPVRADGRPGGALVAAGDRAGVLVVGSRGRGALASRVLGSTSAYCVRHAQVPVIVVPSEANVGRPNGRVVVGFDGSSHARRSLEWTLRHTPASARVDVVHAWDPERVTGAQVADMKADQLASQSQELLAQAREVVRAQGLTDQRDLTMSSREGDPRLVLRREARDADALVVGVRGHRPMMELLVGSVTTTLVESPDVVTVVVR